MELLWFIIIMVFFGGFFLLEGFDFGVGMLLPFLGKSEGERGAILRTVGPFWDGNEVWLITAGGAMLAAFPGWYASLFSGFYVLMFLMLAALIVRGAAFEFRGKDEQAGWRRFWDWLVPIGSAMPGFLWGLVFANCLRGIPIDASANYVGGVWEFFNPYAILGGLAFTALFLLHGAVFLNLRTEGKLRVRAHYAAWWLALPTIGLGLAFVAATCLLNGVQPGIAQIVVAFLIVVALLAAAILLRAGRGGWTFGMTSLAIASLTLLLALQLFPRVIVSSLNPAWSLTVASAASSPYTLTVMSWLSLSILPFVLAAQTWNYYVFRKRVSVQGVGHH